MHRSMWMVAVSIVGFVVGCSPAPTPSCGNGGAATDPACQQKVFCGGIAGIACPGSGTCVDDPSDSCDPKNGGADCGGICTCSIRALCIKGNHFDPSPTVCACVPDVGSCALVRCASGTHCQVVNDSAQCVEDATTCAAVLCEVGTQCVEDSGVAHCVPQSGVQCGTVTCANGQYCCNASCGMCAPPGVACIQIACE